MVLVFVWFWWCLQLLSVATNIVVYYATLSTARPCSWQKQQSNKNKFPANENPDSWGHLSQTKFVFALFEKPALWDKGAIDWYNTYKQWRLWIWLNLRLKPLITCCKSQYARQPHNPCVWTMTRTPEAWSGVTPAFSILGQVSQVLKLFGVSKLCCILYYSFIILYYKETTWGNMRQLYHTKSLQLLCTLHPLGSKPFVPFLDLLHALFALHFTQGTDRQTQRRADRLCPLQSDKTSLWKNCCSVVPLC